MGIFKRKENIILILILTLGSFLRFYRLDELMPFIADQGWFYIQARDALLSGSIPLVGIPSSHPWLHQGAFWTYILMILFKIFNFNPITPAYFTATLGVVTIAIVYKLGSNLFSRKVGLLSSFLYATSPLVIADSRMAYHTSPIPFLTAILIYSVYKWLKGSLLFFPFVIFLLAVLYNFEIATFTLAIIVFLIFSFGVIKKKTWVVGLFKPKFVTLSALGLVIPMVPMIIYDLSHGFPQTLRFGAWLFYRVAVFFGFPPINPNSPAETWITFISFFVNQLQKLIFLPSKEFSVAILALAIGYVGYRVFKDYKRRSPSIPYILVLLFTTISIAGYIAAKTNSAAYLLILYPQISIVIALFWKKIFYPRKKTLGIILLILIFLTNSYFLIKANFLTGPTFVQRIEAAKEIIEKSDNKPYNIEGQGEGSQYESFIMPHEYLTWWLGQGPSRKNEKLKFYVSEHPDRIDIENTK